MVFVARALRFVLFKYPKRLMNSAVPGVELANWGNCSAPTARHEIAYRKMCRPYDVSAGRDAQR